MATADASHPEPRSLERAVLGDGFERVLRAGRREATARWTPRHEDLVAADHLDREPGHGAASARSDPGFRGAGARHRARDRGHRAARSRAARRTARSVSCSSVGVVFNAAGPALRRYRPPGTSSTSSSRTAARSRRRIRLRSTAPPTAFGTAYATLGGCVGSPGRSRAPSAPCRRAGARARSRKGAWPRTRQIRRRVWRDRADAGSSVRSDPRGYASGDGIRASCCASAGSAGRSASRMASSRGSPSGGSAFDPEA